MDVVIVNKKDDERKKARELRLKGWSYSQIVEELGVSKGSVSHWCRDIRLTPEQKEVIHDRQIKRGANNKGARTNEIEARKGRQKAQKIGREQAKTGSELHLMGCMLYWAEGAKSKPNYVHFANSDPEMLLLMMQFFRNELNVLEEQFKLQIHCYAQDDTKVEAIEQYWLNLLQLKRDCLYKTQRLQGSERSLNRLPKGIGAIRINSTELLMQILGAIQEYGDFDNPDWLF